ncbi:MAG: DUF502 domain-containing protein [Phycisphaerae bacterium]|nr:DUF502 domain-containing protein [Phycisphaerae bacterium]
MRLAQRMQQPEDTGTPKRRSRRFFLRGLGTLLPTLVTLYLLYVVVMWVYNLVGRHISKGIYWLTSLICASFFNVDFDNILSPKHWELYVGWWLALAVVVVAVYIFGRLVGTWIGRGLWRVTERTVTGMPVIRKVYPHVKQVTDFMLADKRKFQLEASRVVAVEYPRKGIWSLGLVTGGGMRAIRDRAGEDVITVFIPSSPTPFTGYTIVVNKREAVEVPITFDEALRYTISGGVLTPQNQTPKADAALAGGAAPLPGVGQDHERTSRPEETAK